jgi:DNA-binding response OmpR family regulator
VPREKILIVDDDPVVIKTITGTLNDLDCAISATGHGATAIDLVRRERFDLMLLDLVLEDINGINVLRSIRSFDPDLVVILLTAYGSMDSAIEALRLGANDYIIKPFSPVDLHQRVSEALARRVPGRSTTFKTHADQGYSFNEGTSISSRQEQFLQRGCLLMDLYKRRAFINDEALNLTTSEYNVLWTLAWHAPEAVSPQRLLKQALGYDASSKEAGKIIKWHIHQLRKKIEADAREPMLIKTIRYQGYAWVG